MGLQRRSTGIKYLLRTSRFSNVRFATHLKECRFILNCHVNKPYAPVDRITQRGCLFIIIKHYCINNKGKKSRQVSNLKPPPHNDSGIPLIAGDLNLYCTNAFNFLALATDYFLDLFGKHMCIGETDFLLCWLFDKLPWTSKAQKKGSIMNALSNVRKYVDKVCYRSSRCAKVAKRSF